MNLTIIADFPTFSVIDKPSGILTTPGKDDSIPDMVTLFRKTFPGVIMNPEVHRLDMDTSGILLMAKNLRTHRLLSEQFAERVIKKTYYALLDGILENKESGHIELPFRLDYDNKPRQKYDPEKGKMGITDWQKISIEGNFTRVRLNPVTGRTHQLRVHCAHPLGVGIPIVGDRLYGSGTKPGELKLHAAQISLIHPDTYEWITFNSSTPF